MLPNKVDVHPVRLITHLQSMVQVVEKLGSDSRARASVFCRQRERPSVTLWVIVKELVIPNLRWCRKLFAVINYAGMWVNLSEMAALPLRIFRGSTRKCATCLIVLILLVSPLVKGLTHPILSTRWLILQSTIISLWSKSSSAAVSSLLRICFMMCY